MVPSSDLLLLETVVYSGTSCTMRSTHYTVLLPHATYDCTYHHLRPHRNCQVLQSCHRSRTLVALVRYFQTRTFVPYSSVISLERWRTVRSNKNQKKIETMSGCLDELHSGSIDLCGCRGWEGRVQWYEHFGYSGPSDSGLTVASGMRPGFSNKGIWIR